MHAQSIKVFTIPRSILKALIKMNEYPYDQQPLLEIVYSFRGMRCAETVKFSKFPIDSNNYDIFSLVEFKRSSGHVFSILVCFIRRISILVYNK